GTSRREKSCIVCISSDSRSGAQQGWIPPPVVRVAAGTEGLFDHSRPVHTGRATTAGGCSSFFLLPGADKGGSIPLHQRGSQQKGRVATQKLHRPFTGVSQAGAQLERTQK